MWTRTLGVLRTSQAYHSSTVLILHNPSRTPACGTGLPGLGSALGNGPEWGFMDNNCVFWSWIGQTRCWREVVWVWRCLALGGWFLMEYLSETLHFLFCFQKKKKILESWLLIYQLLKLEKVFLQWSGVEVSLAASQPLQRRWLCQQWICLGESL